MAIRAPDGANKYNDYNDYNEYNDYNDYSDYIDISDYNNYSNLDWEQFSELVTSDTVDYYWQIAKLELWHWGLVIYNESDLHSIRNSCDVLHLMCTISYMKTETYDHIWSNTQ